MQYCGFITSKNTPCRLNKATCRFHNNLTVPILPESNESKYTNEEKEIISEFSRDKLYATVHTTTFTPVWEWHDFSYYTHVWVNEDCDEVDVCVNNNRPCVIFCQCSGCQSDKVNIKFLNNEKNGHCIRCQCYDCVCPMRKLHKQYEQYITLPHPFNICGETSYTCYICQKILRYKDNNY